MTRTSGARISFALLLVALVVTWRITRPQSRVHHPRPKPAVHGAAESLASRENLIETSASDPVLLPVERASSRPATRAGTRKIWFHVTTMDGVPIAGACVQPLFVPGVFMTDASGNGSF